MAKVPTHPGENTDTDARSFSEQELAEPAANNGGVHPSYVVRPGKYGVVDISPPFGEIPVIDLGRLGSEFLEERETEMDKLRIALSDWGCFQATCHGVPEELLADITEITTQFFALPSDEKMKYARDAADIEGYGNDPVLSEDQVLDWSTRLVLKLLPHHTRRPNLWPKDPIKFSEVLNEYAEKVKTVIDLLIKAMASSLGLEEDCFSEKYGNGAFMAARFNHSHPCPNPGLVLGTKAHSDGSGLTVLLPDPEVEGLQFLKDGEWFRVPILPGALVVNTGEQMQIMSNGIFKSPIHRVTAPSKRGRISVVIFYLPDPELEIGPVKRLITDERPRLYRDVWNYSAINFKCFQKGESAIDTVKV